MVAPAVAQVIVTVTEPGKVPPAVTTGRATCSNTVYSADTMGLLKKPEATVIVLMVVTVWTVSNTIGRVVGEDGVGSEPSSV